MGLGRVGSALRGIGLRKVETQEQQGAVILTGRVSTWEEWLAAGYAAANQGFRGVVNDIEVVGIPRQQLTVPGLRDGALEGLEFDVAIIGGGVIGCAVARELSRYSLKIVLLEKEEDVAKQTSSRNNGMIHPGLVSGRGGLKIAYNTRGNRMYTKVAQELDFKLRRAGSLVLLAKASYRLMYPAYWLKARRDKVDGIAFMGRKEVFALEPHVWPGQQGAFFLPSTGVVDPASVTVAYAENAIANGVRVSLNTAVTALERRGEKIIGIHTNRGRCRAKLVINAAGVWADRVAEMAGDRFFTIHPRKGVIAILDKKAARFLTHGLSLPSPGQKFTKGGGLNPTVEDNLLMGPTATEVPWREDWSTAPEDLDFLLRRHLILNAKLSSRDIITYFAGVRACTFEEDFVIGPSQVVHNLVHVAGIQSPGLASAPAIAQDAAMMAIELLGREIKLIPNPAFNPLRQAQHRPGDLDLERRTDLIRAQAAYGRILCRCEEVSEGEISDAVKAPLPALTLDGVKRRTRAGMGRCQGGFCAPSVLKVIAREGGVPMTSVEKNCPGSPMVFAETKGEGGNEDGCGNNGSGAGGDCRCSGRG